MNINIITNPHKPFEHVEKQSACFLFIAAFHLLILTDTFSQKKLTTIVVDAGHGGSETPVQQANMKIHYVQKKKILHWPFP